ncbi:MAG: glucose-1-phosphate cytidylyltransferase [Nitrospinota bacterium]|jgi:glucose-1-phosphate cytidylyltransferase|nr:glucose-1-phosphate cytidylyltransferase [Nitrospinota bacterium]MDP7350217.1 glucose-1-phosphate cytidylyltransferase [Nitrospinota bacterium]HJN02589.1 glucose-1-phosphate cytidylyltransferase [Nitrospinota bacterium]|tara:strand:- start:9512 stop:10282 length:771 start_codon:yes stop_codon:yes gene_type:complete
MLKVVILAGGRGTRISEESVAKPKPMIEIGGKPILWHIMKSYSSFGFNEFIICLGFKGYIIKEYFANYYLHMNDVTIDIKKNDCKIHQNLAEPWKVTLIDTGEDTMTGGRIKRIKKYVGDEPFMLTYGDGVSDIDISKLLAFHEGHGKYATVTATQPPGRFGAMDIDAKGKVLRFQEKASGNSGWINGGFMILQSEIFNYLEKDQTIFEKDPLENLAKDNQLIAYKYTGFWHPMDTMRDKIYLESLWIAGKAPWKS